MKDYCGVKFTPARGNKIPYGQDFRFLRGLPPIEFVVTGQLSQSVIAAAHGYGLKDNYGNGKVYISINDFLPVLESADCLAFDPGI